MKMEFEFYCLTHSTKVYVTGDKETQCEFNFLYGGELYVVRSMTDLYDQVAARNSNLKDHFVIYLNGKLLNRNRFLADYGLNMMEMYTIEVDVYCLFGGAESKIVDCETYLEELDSFSGRQHLPVAARKISNSAEYESRRGYFEKKMKITQTSSKKLKKLKQKVSHKMRLQGDIGTSVLEHINVVTDFAQKYLDDDIVKFVEDALIYAYMVQQGYLKVACITFLKLRMANSLSKEIMHVAKEFVTFVASVLEESELQGFEDKVTDFRGILDRWEEMKKSSIGIKYWKIVMYMVRFGVMSHVGVKPTPENHKYLEKVTPISLMDGADFAYCLVDALTMTLQRVLIWQRTGNWEVMLHGPKVYQKWFDQCTDLKRKSVMLSNLKLIGESYFSFTSSVKDAISQGEAIVRFGTENKLESKAARSMLNDMKVLDLNILSAKAAQEERPAPFSILVNGRSSIGKSMFSKILFYAFANYCNLPASDEYRYVRDPRQDFWSGFASYKWFIHLDDVSYNLPGNQMDKSLEELITVINNVPFVPNQAALEDKGRTPLRAEMVVATTNTKHLNAADYFSCPLAVLRRLPWVVTITPKDGCGRDDSPQMLDGSKVHKVDGTFMNVWNIKVEKVVPGGLIGGDRETGKHVPAIPASNGKTAEENSTFNDIYLFLDWFKSAVISFRQLQHQAMTDDADMAAIKLCDVCNRPIVRVGSEVPREHRCNCALQGKMDLEEITSQTDLYGTVKLTIVGKNVFAVRDVNGKVLDISFSGTAYGKPFSTHDGVYRDKYIVKNSVVIQHAAFPMENAKCMKPKSESMQPELQTLLSAVIQRQVHEEPSKIKRIGMTLGGRFVKWYFQEGLVFKMVQFFMGWAMTRSLITRYIHAHLEHVYTGKAYFEALGKIRAQFVFTNFLMVIAGLAALSAAIVGYFALTRKSKEIEYCESTTDTHFSPSEVSMMATSQTEFDRRMELLHHDACNEHRGPLTISTPQAAEVSDEYFAKEETENVWKKVDMEVTAFDLDPMSVNYASLDSQVLLDTLRRNVFRIDSKDIETGRGNRGNALCVGGHLFVTNNHLLVPGETLTIKLGREATCDGVTSNVEFDIESSKILRCPQRDLAWFECFAMSPLKDLTKLIAKDSFRMGTFRGNYVSRDAENCPCDFAIKAITPDRAFCQALNETFDYWQGVTNVPTVNGSCGSPMIVRHEKHVTIVGLHQLGNTGSCDVRAVALQQQDLLAARKFFTRPLVQSGVPALQAEGAVEKILDPIPFKSPLLWVKSGSLNKYGHIRGSRVNPRSKVKATLCAERFLHDREWECTFVAPKFDWRPYNHMYNDILGSRDNIKTSVLDQAVDAFANDLIAGLPKSAKENLKIVSWEAALNGIDGVKYVDKMNFNSSMGFPWNKSKRYFLSEVEDPHQKKTLPDHVWSRAAEAERRYKAGVRYCPVFSGQAKDEARAQEKVDVGKIRIFTGAPVDWSLCVRRYLLTFIKTVQENQLLFEAAPGCVAQSLEWEKFREHLTKFGLDRIIAGDYGKFDKRMIAKMILAAFEVIVRVLRDAGWSEEELQVIYGIAEDTAYPVTNVAGDLVEFFGSNPSGHPLTVIINSIVNALYMRYCYILLNPEREATTFKEMVALLTYGDDNTMGVSKMASWFNHTSIRNELAKIGVEYTMADKKSESVPFISIDDVSFLKRTWRWDSDVQAYVCPLDVKSIQKSLLINLPSGTLSSEMHMIEVMNGAVNEWFFHGHDIFEKERAYLLNVVMTSGLEEEYATHPFPTWEDLVARFKKASKDVVLDRFGGAPAPPEWLESF